MSRNDSYTETINRITHLIQTDDSVDAPPDAVQWSKNIFRARAAAPKKLLTQKILAVLQMNLSPNQAAFGERSASASQARQMLFQADETSIDLRIIREEKDGFSLHGQILGEDFTGGMVKLGDFETSINEPGEFKFAKITGGKYDLILQKNEREIIIENLQLD